MVSLGYASLLLVVVPAAASAQSMNAENFNAPRKFPCRALEWPGREQLRCE